jgi:hypothetical protein
MDLLDKRIIILALFIIALVIGGGPSVYNLFRINVPPTFSDNMRGVFPL